MKTLIQDYVKSEKSTVNETSRERKKPSNGFKKPFDNSLAVSLAPVKDNLVTVYF